MQPFCIADDALWLALPCLPQILQHLLPLGGREIRASVSGAAIRQGEAIERPSPAAGHQLHSAHVYLVDIRAFFAIHLDAYEALVHHSRYGIVLEALALH